MTALAFGENVVTITPENPVVRYSLAASSSLHIYSTGSFDTFCAVLDSALSEVAVFDDSSAGVNFDFVIPTDIPFANYYFDISLYGQAAENAVFSVFVEAITIDYDYTDIVIMFDVGGVEQIIVDSHEIGYLEMIELINYNYTGTVDMFTVGGTVSTFLGFEVAEVGVMPLVGNPSYSYDVYIPPNWIQRNYTAKIGNLPLPIASFNATLSASGSSYVSLQISAVNSQFLDEILARKAEPIVVTRSHLYSDGSTKERVFIRVNFDTINSDSGPKSGTTINLTGRKSIPVQQSKDVYESNAFYRNYNAGSVRYRLPINDALNLGDRLHIDDSSFIVGKITYSVGTANAFMECAEYIADGTDSTGIGNNIRPTPLQAYLIVEDHPNYFLWQSKGYLYNKRAFNPADATNYSSPATVINAYHQLLGVSVKAGVKRPSRTGL